MKKVFYVIMILLSSSFSRNKAFSQVTIVLQPDETTSKDALIYDYTPNTNYGLHPDFTGNAWSNSGTATIGRSLIDFDFSAIPSGSTIVSATLSLYHYNSTNTVGHSTISGSNACWLKRITSTWDEMTVTWNNQPSTTTQNQVNIPASTSTTQDYPNIDVTSLVTDIYNNPSTSFGMMLMLQTEQYYRSLLFASSNNPVVAKRPMLSITYLPPTPSNDTCITVRTTFGKGSSALVWDNDPNTNYNNHPDFTGNAWTSGGDPTIGRCLMNLDLSSMVPTNAVITSAYLYLYHYNSPWTVGHSSTSGSNDCWLRRITSPWSESTVTWNNQPTYTTTNEVHLPASLNDTMNYPNIDVTNLITDIWNNYSTSYGFIIMLNTEQYYRSLLFGSNKCADSTKRPVLKICYHMPLSINENTSNVNSEPLIFPNPVNGSVSIEYTIPENSEVTINFFSVSGELIESINLGHETKGKHIFTNVLSTAKYCPGIYFTKIITDKIVLTNKFVKVD